MEAFNHNLISPVGNYCLIVTAFNDNVAAVPEDYVVIALTANLIHTRIRAVNRVVVPSDFRDITASVVIGFITKVNFRIAGSFGENFVTAITADNCIFRAAEVYCIFAVAAVYEIVIAVTVYLVVAFAAVNRDVAAVVFVSI